MTTPATTPLVDLVGEAGRRGYVLTAAGRQALARASVDDLTEAAAALAQGVTPDQLATEQWDGEPCFTAVTSEITAPAGLPAVLTEIAAERRRQDDRWGEQNHPDGTGIWYADRAAAERTRTNNAAADGTLTFRHVLAEEVAEAFAEDDPAKLRAELVQVAAVAAAWIEAIDRRTSKETSR
jgi:hypothetical protein